MNRSVSMLNYVVLACAIVAAVMFASSPKPLPKDPKFAEQINSSDIVLVKFGADWCGPCRQVEGELDRLASTTSNLSVVKIDIERDRKLATHYGVKSIPHLVLFKHGEQIGQYVGYLSHSELKAWIGPTSKSANTAKRGATENHVIIKPANLAR